MAGGVPVLTMLTGTVKDRSEPLKQDPTAREGGLGVKEVKAHRSSPETGGAGANRGKTGFREAMLLTRASRR